eukprot:7372529-Prymnesium_polylepis.1
MRAAARMLLSEQRAAWPCGGLGCQLAAALAVADGRLQVVPVGSAKRRLAYLGTGIDTGFSMGHSSAHGLCPNPRAEPCLCDDI